MNIGWIFLICAAVVTALLAFLARAKRDASPDLRQEARLDEADARLTRRDDVLRLLQAKQKIEAIKVYRADTGAGLADAKAAVERMSSVAPSGDQMAMQDFPEAAGEVSGPLRDEIERLLLQKQKIGAIKLYRERTQVGLSQAKAAVEQIERELLTGGRAFSYTSAPDQEPTSESPVASPEVRQLVQRGRKIEAIKLYREQTGLGLREAKQVIDLMGDA